MELERRNYKNEITKNEFVEEKKKKKNEITR